MLIKNKISFITVDEFWFRCNLKNCLFSLKVMRDCRYKSTNKFCKKVEKYTLITDLSKGVDNIFKNFKSNYRNEIRKVKKLNNLIVEKDSISIKQFVDFYNKFLAIPKGLSFINERRLTKFGKNITFFSAKIDNELTHIQVYIIDKDEKIVRLLHSVNILHTEKNPIKKRNIGHVNKYLHWYSIEYFIEKEYKIFDWGGYSNNKNNSILMGIDNFKKGFGGELIKIYDYYSLFLYLYTNSHM